MLNEVADIVTIVGFPLAFIGISLAYREGRNSRDLEAALDISESFLSKFFFTWRHTVREREKLLRGEPVQEDELTDTLLNIINWLDTVGFMIDSHLLARPERVLPSMARTLRLMLEDLRPILEAYEHRDGPERWHGVRVLEQAVSVSGTPAKVGVQ